MGSAIGDILPLAVGVALSHGAIIAIIVLLGSPHAWRTGPAYLLGWLLGLGLVEGITLAIASSQHLSAGGKPAMVAALLKLFFGAFFLAWAGRQWRQAGSSQQPHPPRWLTWLSGCTPSQACFL